MQLCCAFGADRHVLTMRITVDFILYLVSMLCCSLLSSSSPASTVASEQVPKWLVIWRQRLALCCFRRVNDVLDGISDANVL